MSGEILLGADDVARLAEPALALADEPGVAGVEVVVQRDWGGLTRFANSQVHQNVWTEDVAVSIRVVTDDARIGVAGASTDDPAGVAATARSALEIARVSPPDPDYGGLAGPAEVATVPFDRAAAVASPGERADAVRALLGQVPSDLEAAGSYRTGGTEVGVYTSLGQAVYSPLSATELTVVVTGSTSSGYAEAGGRVLADVDPVATARVAVEKARAGADPVAVDPGRWAVVLEPAATATLVQFLAYLGFGGRDWLEGRAFTSARLGEQVVDPRITIVDDALAPDTIGLPFDYEGTPKRRIELIRDGVATAVVHDRYTAGRAGVASTGHALPAPNPHGPVATNPLLVPGDDGGVADLLAGMERGLLVTRFHYTNVIHQLDTTITGMTRDGTFLVEDGKVVAPVRNLRFTQSILEALAEVEAISSTTAYSSEFFFGGSRCPALRLPAFTFTGSTTFG